MKMDNKEKKNIKHYQQCPQLYYGDSYQGIAGEAHPVFLDDVEIYAYSYRDRGDSIITYPIVSSPLFQPFVVQTGNISYRDYFEARIRVSCDRGTLELGEGIPFIDNKYATNTLALSYDRKTEYHTYNDKLLIGDRKGKTLSDYKVVLNYEDLSIPPLISKESRVVVLLEPEPYSSALRHYLNTFIAILSGDYIIPHPYEVKSPTGGSFTIINEPIYGQVRLHGVDGRFYLQYTRNKEGALVGEVIRTRLIPCYEDPEEEEIEGCLVLDQLESDSLVPVYFSYYHPDGSGKQITREEYIKLRSKIIYESVSTLPKELTDLLGF